MNSNQAELYAENLDISGSAGDSNALILIPRNKKNKGKNKGRANVRPGIGAVNSGVSKSQKRKLKKLEEEKEKADLLSKSLEDLEKYKLPEDMYSLLQPSYSIGQVETALEKRRKKACFSKAGLDIPYSDDGPKKRGDQNVANELDMEDFISQHNFKSDYSVDANSVKVIDAENTLDEPICEDQVVSGDVQAVGFRDMKTENEVDCKSTPENAGNYSLMSCPAEKKNTLIKDMHKEGFDIVPGKTNSPSDYPVQGFTTTPIVVHVSRPEEIENKRKDLPIIMMEQEIMEAINYNSTVIICGETGCGKTTQVPQFLYEAGFGSSLSYARRGIIGVTQPRRVAVLSTAKRVACELGLHLGKEVGFQVRHDKRIGDKCCIKFMTDGILLREVQNDFMLKRYSVILLDEAHERSLNTDILIGMLSGVIRTRQLEFEKQQRALRSGQNLNPEDMIFPLKLVLMSATLRVEDFNSGARLFCNPPPVIQVPTRQFPVTTHFSKRTDIVDYIGQAYRKVLSIHRRLPQGGILVFVTGQREVDNLCKKLRKASRELDLNKSRSSAADVATETPAMNSSDGVNVKEINEAFEVDETSAQRFTDRFSSYDEDQFGQSEDESDVSYDDETESEEEETIGNDGTLLGGETHESKGDLLNFLGEDGSLASLKAAFETLGVKASTNSDSEGKQTVNAGDASANPDSEGKQSVFAGNASTNSDSEGKQTAHVTLDMYSEHSCPDVGGEKRVKNESSFGTLRVLPLYAMLPAAEQLRVFEEVKEGERLVVVATNVAETSLTIPGIKYVVDTGREKVKNYNSTNGMETYEIQFISKASAAQRAGRAGRTGPGHCYRLYSSAVFHNMFPEFSCPEISKVPIDGVVLLLKSMGIGKVAKFPFPTPPEKTALEEADRCLKALEALDEQGRLTPLGKAMSYYPMGARHSRMLLTVIKNMREVNKYARASIVLGYAVAVAAALSLSNPFLKQLEGSNSVENELERDDRDGISANTKAEKKEEKLRKKKVKEAVKASRAKFLNLSSDALSIAYALQCFELSRKKVDFCNEYGLHLKTMEEMSKLRKQLLQLVFHQNKSFCCQEFLWTHGTLEDIENAWSVSSAKQPLLAEEEDLLGQAICAGWADRVAKRIRGHSGLSDGDTKVSAVRYQACMVKETVFLHRWSSLSRSAPEYLVYSELLHTKRPYMHGATSVKPEWLVKYARPLCTFSARLEDPKPYYDPQTDEVFSWSIPTFGPQLWQLPLHSMPVKKKVDRVVVFAYALLEGQVLPCLKSYRNHMVAPPSIILRCEAYGQRHVGNLIAEFTKLSINNCATLREVWNKNKRELYSEILDWFQKGFHSGFPELWLQMLEEVALGAQDRFPKEIKRTKKKSKRIR